MLHKKTRHPIVVWVTITLLIGAISLMLWSYLPPIDEVQETANYVLYAVAFLGFVTFGLGVTYVMLRCFFHYQATHSKYEHELHLEDIPKEESHHIVSKF